MMNRMLLTIALLVPMTAIADVGFLPGHKEREEERKERREDRRSCRRRRQRCNEAGKKSPERCDDEYARCNRSDY